MSETIVFFGSGPVAAQSLEKLTDSFNIEAVITKPQPSHHKHDFPVISIAKKHKLKLLTANNKKELDELFKRQAFKSKLGLVIDYGIIISKQVIDYFPFGIVNSHFSLLPKLRGPDPISFAILNGDKETGVSLMLIDESLDEGLLLAQRSKVLSDDITTPQLTNDLIELSHKLLVATLSEHLKGSIKSYKQEGAPSYSRKLDKADSLLDWEKPATVLEREIRAFLDWPRSKANIKDYEVIVTKASIEAGDGIPGKLWRQDKKLGVYTSKGILVIEKLIPPGKKEMPVSAFLAGYTL